MHLFSCYIVLTWVVLVQAVNRPPNIYIQADKNIYYKPGESVTVPCVADGIPKPTYTWQRNGEKFNPSGNDDRIVQLPNQGTIVFNSPEAKDEGIFQCFADNNYGVSASVKINLREGKHAEFAYEAEQTHYAEAGDSLTLPCIPPVSFPPADVFWVVKEKDGRWQAINFDRRVSMDLEGRLRFTNVKKSDERDGKAYACMSINYFMRSNSIGPEHKVIVLGTTEQKRPAYELWTSPNNQFFLKGGLLKLKCIFGGNPTPDVYWEKINGELPNRAQLKSFGQELWIQNLSLSDAGDYECMGLNTESSKRPTKAYTIIVESGPYWTDEPVDIEAGEGEKATFICMADGEPKPTYTWYINGVPLDSVRDSRINSSRFSTPNQNNITLTNLNLEDHMNIQCNATNKHDYVWADVYLNVLAEKPTIIVPPPPSIKVAEGQSVIITCQVTGKPDPIITWYRDTSLITGGRFKILPNGNLLIQNVVMADAGDYRCQASNKFAKDVTSSECKVSVRRKTRIEQFPQDLEVIAGYDAKFTCSGSTDFDEARNMRVYWLKDDKEVSTAEQRMTQNFQDNSLTISGTIVRDSGVYTCVITNGLDEDKAYAILTVKDRPDPPSGVEIDRCRQSSADLKWIKGIENNAPVQYFIIQYNTTFNPDQWISARTVDYTQNTANIELSPWANYTFRILATNKIGAGPPSFHTAKVCRTDPAQPFKNPENVRSIGSKKGFLVIEWTPMTELEHNGPGFKYQLTVKERGGPSSTYNIDNWRNESMEINVGNTKVYTPYLVKIQAKNNEGDSTEDPEEKTLYSFEDIPKARAYDVQIGNVNASSALLTWSWDSLWLEESGMMDQVQGELKGFKIQFWRAGEKLNTFREISIPVIDVIPVTLNGNRKKRATLQAQYNVTYLTPFSNMQIQVCVANNYYVGAPSDAISFNTLEGVPGPVLNFQAQVRSSNSFTLTWLIPAVEDRNGILVGYDIGYQSVDGLKLGAFHDRDEQINDPNAQYAILSGLLPNRKYRVHIFARTRFGRGEGTFIEVSTTPRMPLGAPQFEVPFIGENMINVTWTPGAYWGTHVVHYVEYRKDGAADWQQSTDEVLRNYKELTDLEKGTYYQIRVVAFDGVSRAASEIKVVGTVGFAAARAVAANYGWFVGMLLAGLVCIAIIVFVYYYHKKHKYDERRPKETSGKVIRQNDFDRDSRGQYNDYYKEDRKRYRNRDNARDSYEDYDKREDDNNQAHGYKNHEYDEKNGGFEQYDDKDKNEYDHYRDRDYDYDDQYDDDYDRDYDRDRGYDRDSYRRRDYDDYDDDYDRDSYRDGDSYREYDDEDYEPYDSKGKGRAGYDRPPSYDRSASYDDQKMTDVVDDSKYEEPSKFDKDGYPVDTKPSSSKDHSSTFV